MTLCIQGQSQSSLPGEWNTKTFPDFRYSFDDIGDVEFEWINDIGSYGRTGRYETKEDSIYINYAPIFKFDRIDSLSKTDILQIKLIEPNDYIPVLFKVFGKDSSHIHRPDSNGYLNIHKPTEVDSIYFGNSKYLTNSFYQIPTELIAANCIEMKVNQYLLNYEFKSNKATLIRISDNEICNGEKHNPESIYFGGILTRKTKPNKKINGIKTTVYSKH